MGSEMCIRDSCVALCLDVGCDRIAICVFPGSRNSTAICWSRTDARQEKQVAGTPRMRVCTYRRRRAAGAYYIIVSHDSDSTLIIPGIGPP